MKKLLLRCAFGFLILGGCSVSTMQTGKDWPVYGGNKAGNRYSPLAQINTANVGNLQVAWMYDASEGSDPRARGRAIQCQPIVVNGIMYATTPLLKLFAVDAGTGKQLWKFEPSDRQLNVNRGVTYWQNKNDKRILYTVGSTLYAINASDGKPVKSFGKDGIVDLYEGLSDGIEANIRSSSVSATSPGVVYQNTFVIGSSMTEAADAPPGSVRAFDVVTGKLKWVFHTVPRPGEFGYDTWPKDAYKTIGAVNTWSGMVLDEKRGAVYFGTGSPSSDFYGGNREGRNLFATCIMSLNAETGKMNWYFQTIRHDLWDRDLPLPPNLSTVRHEGKLVDVVVQATKDGLVYVLDRDKGTSLFPIEERPVPTNGLPGEHPYPTQLYPVKPLPFAHQVFTEDDITNISSEAHAFVKGQFDLYRTDNKFAPPNQTGTILFGYSGGAEWGGNATDKDGILYQNSNDDPWLLQMIDTADRNREIASVSRGNGLYLTNCAACHGADRRGSGPELPPLNTIGSKYSAAEIQSILRSGKGRMPAFQQISENDRNAIVSFLLNPSGAGQARAAAQQNPGSPAVVKNDFGFKPAFLNKVWKKFTDQDGYPAIKPPWGTLNAIDLNTGDYLWRVPLGEFSELTKKGIPVTGTESYGGPVVTAGGLIFIAGTRDEKIRAFDKKTGKVVWEYQLPAGGYATPITYEVKGKQFVAIAAGGARGGKQGGNYIAFTLK